MFKSLLFPDNCKFNLFFIRNLLIIPIFKSSILNLLTICNYERHSDQTWDFLIVQENGTQTMRLCFSSAYKALGSSLLSRALWSPDLYGTYSTVMGI